METIVKETGNEQNYCENCHSDLADFEFCIVCHTRLCSSCMETETPRDIFIYDFKRGIALDIMGFSWCKSCSSNLQDQPIYQTLMQLRKKEEIVKKLFHSKRWFRGMLVYFRYYTLLTSFIRKNYTPFLKDKNDLEFYPKLYFSYKIYILKYILKRIFQR